jgi:hypothetical protein
VADVDAFRYNKPWPRCTKGKPLSKLSDIASYSETNWIVMDYLVSEGYPGAAEKFAEETNMDLPSAPQKIRERVLIRNALHAGRVDEAVGLINEIDHQVRPRTLLAFFFRVI